MATVTTTSVNYWPDDTCAKAFWSQRKLPPYRRLLADTAAWLDPQPGERWLDLGCGSGQLTRTFGRKAEERWRKSPRSTVRHQCRGHQKVACPDATDRNGAADSFLAGGFQ